MRLLLVRHAEPQRASVTADDPELSDLGRAQAARVAHHLRWSGPLERTTVYSSPMRRAQETAAAIAAALDLPVQVDEQLVEFDHGSDYLHFEDGAAVWDRYLAGDLTPWGTTLTAFASRVRAAAERLADRHPHEHVIAVCHGGVVNTWASQVLGVPERIRVMQPQYGSVSRFRRDALGWAVESLNEHWPEGLRKHDLSTTN